MTTEIAQTQKNAQTHKHTISNFLLKKSLCEGSAAGRTNAQTQTHKRTNSQTPNKNGEKSQIFGFEVVRLCVCAGFVHFPLSPIQNTKYL